MGMHVTAMTARRCTGCIRLHVADMAARFRMEMHGHSLAFLSFIVLSEVRLPLPKEEDEESSDWYGSELKDAES